MAASMWDTSARSAFLDRLKELTPATPARWGKLNASGMVAHLNDSYRMNIGELQVKPKNLPLRYTPIKQIVIHLLPFPKGAPTAPELIARCDGAVLADEKAAFEKMIAKLAAVKPGTSLPPHPAFGDLSYGTYGVLLFRHTDHHFKQFGI